MTKNMKKTWWVIPFLLFTLPMIFNGQNNLIQIGKAYPIPPIFYFDGPHSRSPQFPDAAESVKITCSVTFSGGDYLAISFLYRFNGGSLVSLTMTNKGGGTYEATIPGAILGTFVEYRMRGMAEAGGELFIIYSPSSTGYHSYTVSEPSDISWVSPANGLEITFGPIDDNIVFNFDWTYQNLDDVDLVIGSQVFDIFNGATQTKIVTLDGVALDGSTVPATLKGYKGGIQVASAARTFSFRRLDYSLHWDSPDDGNIIAFSPTGLAKFNFTFTKGVDIDHVNLFFNNSDKGVVTSPGTYEFTFEDFQGTIEATLKGYDSSDNLRTSDTQIFVFRRLVVEVVWETPYVNTSFTFNPGTDPEQFNLTFSKGTDVEYVTLSLNGVDFGNVTSPESVSFIYGIDTHGLIEAVLSGYNAVGSQISSDTRYFRFEKIVDQRFEIFAENEINLGKKLYLILHDPNGDNSISSYEQSTALSLGVGCEITAGVTAGLEIGVKEEGSFFGLFETGFSASSKLSLSMEASLGFDVRFDITDSTFLSSSDSSSDPGFIGPGNGDRYWGEIWKLKYVFTRRYVEYFNTTQIYFDPHLRWGILRDVESYLSDANAPVEWKTMNPVHQDFPEEQVEWVGGSLVADGAGTYTNTHEVTNTNTLTESLTIGIDSETQAKLSAGGAYVEASLELSFKTKVYAELSVGNTITTSYTIQDDEPKDSIVQKVGIDKNFGTYIFQTDDNFCSTSKPIEYNTVDYIAPIIGYPTIIYDTDQDFKGPTPQDNPLVTVRIEEEGGIQDAILYYSIDNGTSWRSTPLSEYPGQPEVWHANIPKQVNNTVVIWYLEAIDETGNSAEKLDVTDTYFSYEVGIIINPLEAQTPGFTFWTVLLTFAFGAILITKRRH